MKKIKSELDEKVWAVVGATKVYCKGKTYQQCVMFRDKNNLKSNEYVITTVDAAQRFLENRG